MQFDNTGAVKDRKRYELSQFRGVDTTSAPSEVSPKRATYMRNFENRDGINHKRYGWIDFQRQDVDGIVYGVYNASFGDEKVEFLYYKSNSDGNYYIKAIGESGTTATTSKIHHLSRGNLYGYCSNDICYFLGIGEFIMCYKGDNGKFFFDKVSNNAFIPLVVTNINDTSYTGQDYIEKIDNYNLVTNLVKFGLVGTSNKDNDITYKLPTTIDCTKTFKILIETSANEDDNINYNNIRKKQSNTEISTVSRNFFNGDYLADSVNKTTINFRMSDNPTDMEKLFYYPNGTIAFELSNGYKFKWKERKLRLYDKDDNEYNDTAYITITNTLDSSSSSKKFICTYNTLDLSELNLPLDDDGFITVKKGTSDTRYNHPIMYGYRLILFNSIYEILDSNSNIVGKITDEKEITFYSENHFEDYTIKNIASPIPQSANIYVTCYDKEYSPSYDINKANYSILFGANGSCDRIFASIDEYPNLIFYSGVSDDPHLEKKAFTYWEDTAYASIGATQNKVTGMTRLNDSTLAIFRENQVNENNFSILTATYKNTETTAQDFSLDLVVSVASANMPQTAVNNNCFGALSRDVLFASKEGVYAIAISNGTSVERYAIERSDPISNMFKDLDMVNAKAIVYKNKYYLAVKDTKTNEDLVLIADARYSYTLDRNMDDTFNYEWYIWNNCPVQQWIIEKDENGKDILGFYDYEGYKCMFKEGNYIDKKYKADHDAVTVVYEANDEHPTLYMIQSSFVGDIFKLENDDNDYVFVKYEKLVDGKQYYVLKVVNSDLTYSDSLTIIDTNDNISLVYRFEPVRAIWFTPTLDLGASDYRKTIFKMTLGINRSSEGNVVLGYRTKYEDTTVVSESFGGAKELDLTDLGFDFLSFGKDFDTSYTNNMKIRDFTNIQFCYGNNVGMDISINNLTILYKYNKFNRGVR